MATSHNTLRVARIAGLVAVLAVGVIAAFVLLGGASTYTIHARFIDAGQVVKGNVVQVSGLNVGTVSSIELTNDNQADIALTLTDEHYQPLHQGTIASIRAAGLAGVANRFINLSPGPKDAPAIPDNGVLPTTQTRPIVDLDEVLNALDPKTRTNLQGIIRNGSQIFAGSAALSANRAFAYLNPALSQTTALSLELGRDRASLERLLTSTAVVSAALAGRRPDLERGIETTAATLRGIAAQRASLNDALIRAPRVLNRSRSTFANLRRGLNGFRPFIRDTRPAAAPLARVLRELVPTGVDARPVVNDLRALLPGLDRSLSDVPQLARVGVPAVRSTTTTLEQALPVFEGLRPYAPDLVIGLSNGFGGATGGYYDANGHFARISLIGSPGSLTGVLSRLGSIFPGLPSAGDFGGYRTGMVARCPGGAVEPAPDQTNPWIPNPALCKKADDQR